MLEMIKQLIRGPAFMAEDQERVKQLINAILFITLLGSFIYGVVIFVLSPTLYASHVIVTLILVHLGFSWILARRGHLTFVSLTILVGLWVLFSLAFFFTGGLSNPSISGYLVIILMAGLLLGGRASLMFAAATFLALTGLFLLERTGLLPVFVPDLNRSIVTYTIQTLYLFIVAALLYLTTRHIQINYQLIHAHAQAVEGLNLELQRETQDRLQMIEAIPAAVIISARAGNRPILWINQMGAKYAHSSTDKLIGRPILDFCADEASKEEIVRLTQGETHLINYEVRLQTWGGDVSWNRISVVPFIYQNQPAHLTIVINTQKFKLAEESLRESEERFRAFVEESYSGIVISMDGVIVDVNEPFAQMFGYTREEMIGLTPIETQTPESAQRVLAHIAAKKEGPIEAVGVRKDGTTFPLEITAKNTIYKGRPARLGGVFDLTEKKKEEEQLLQMQKMESLGILAGGIAHDFNNLLVAMLGQASVALVKMGPDDRARPHIEKVKKAAERAAALTHQLLAYSGGGQFNVQPLQLNDLIQDNIHFFELAVPPSVRLETQLDQQLPLIEADAGQMQQVLMNLILNGAEAIGGNRGVVHLSTEQYYLEGGEQAARYGQLTKQPLPSGDYVCVQITDNGSGMSQEVLSRIFDPFFSTKATGRGLGMAAVLGIIRGHQGGITVASQPGQGTTYRLLFPVMTQTMPAAAPPTESVYNLEQPGAILVIDDEPGVHELVADILTPEQFTIYAAADGASGIQLYQAHADKISLVLLDLSMPGLSGEQSYLTLRQLNPHLKIIFSSGYSEKELPPTILADPQITFLSKPYDRWQLLNRVQAMLHKSLDD
ncbi:MAG: PAS domain S-box protein [Anaerolineae bacterium]|nr:PAS domain S-box protein [Anaerolineae bacterium]